MTKRLFSISPGLRTHGLALFALVLLGLPGAAAAGLRARTKLTEKSTLAEWKAASADSRSEVAVAIARKRLGDGAAKLDVAKAAMEISGCLSATARDARFDAWEVAPTAATCLDAPEKPAKGTPAGNNATQPPAASGAPLPAQVVPGPTGAQNVAGPASNEKK